LTNLTKFTEHNFIEKSHKKHFTVHTLQAIYFLDIDNITFFEPLKILALHTTQIDKTFLLNEITLKEIEEQIDPSHFFSALTKRELIRRMAAALGLLRIVVQIRHR